MTLFRGLLPELSVEASELEIRSAIVKILHNNRSFQLEDFDVNDFEFMDVHEKIIISLLESPLSNWQVWVLCIP